MDGQNPTSANTPPVAPGSSSSTDSSQQLEHILDQLEKNRPTTPAATPPMQTKPPVSVAETTTKVTPPVPIAPAVKPPMPSAPSVTMPTTAPENKPQVGQPVAVAERDVSPTAVPHVVPPSPPSRPPTAPPNTPPPSSSSTKPPQKSEGLLQKMGATKVIVGAIALMVAIGGLTSVVLLSRSSTYNLPKASGPCTPGGSDDGACHSDCHIYTCVNNQWQQGASCTSGELGCNPGGGGGGGGDTVDCDTCGAYNQGACPAGSCGTESDGCDGALHFCGGGCYNEDQTKMCDGVAGCRNPSIACGGDQCSNVNCATGEHCNGGVCVSDQVEGENITYQKYICPNGCGSDSQCTGADSGAQISAMSTTPLTLGDNDCGQVDIYSNGTYSQVAQNSCDSASCGSQSPPPSTPPKSPPPPGSPICIGLTSSISAPKIGDNPVFTCAIAAETTRYEFQWKLGAGAYQVLQPSTAGSNVSAPIAVNASGTYTIQCRPCNAQGCSAWDGIIDTSTQGTLCGGLAGVACESGYACIFANGTGRPTFADEAGTCQVSNETRKN